MPITERQLHTYPMCTILVSVETEGRRLIVIDQSSIREARLELDSDDERTIVIDHDSGPTTIISGLSPSEGEKLYDDIITRRGGVTLWRRTERGWEHPIYVPR